MDINLLVNITSRAWSLPILAHMHEDVAGRQAPLLHATGAGSTAFAQSVAHLIELGVLERNPGHGHPLRPEFRLTAMGKVAASMAHEIHNLPLGAELGLVRKSWTVPILGALHDAQYFNEIGAMLPTATDRALSLSLKSLEQRDWVQRMVDGAARPPRPAYMAVNEGKEISQIVWDVVAA